MRAKDTSGNPLFTSEECLSQSQIARFFSHLASRKVYNTTMMTICLILMTLKVHQAKLNWKNLQLWLHKRLEPYTLSVLTPTTCVICAQTIVLTNYQLILLKEICFAFDIDTSDITMQHKQPDIERILSLCQDCTCQQ